MESGSNIGQHSEDILVRRILKPYLRIPGRDRISPNYKRAREEYGLSEDRTSRMCEEPGSRMKGATDP